MRLKTTQFFSDVYEYVSLEYSFTRKFFRSEKYKFTSFVSETVHVILYEGALEMR